MGYICIPCGQGWYPGHRCAEMISAGGVTDVLVTLSAAEAKAEFERITQKLLKDPSFAELLPRRDRPTPWRP